MPNIASVLKAEISRIARKELRAEIEPLKKALIAYRADLSALKSRAGELEKELRRRAKDVAKTSPTAPALVEDATDTRVRFSAKGLTSQRARLELSAEDCGLLIGASGQSIYNWESGKVRPRGRHLTAIAALKKLGKKSAAEALERLKRAE